VLTHGAWETVLFVTSFARMAFRRQLVMYKRPCNGIAIQMSQVFLAMNDLSSTATTRWISRLGLALTAVVVGAYFAAMIADLAWDVGLLP
jgi:hypothetical protein